MSLGQEKQYVDWWGAERITLLGFIVVLVFVLVLSVLGYSSIISLQQNIQNINEKYNQKNDLIQSLNRVIDHRMMLVRDILLQSDPFMRDELVQKYGQLARDYNSIYKQLASMVSEDTEGGLISRLSEEVTDAVDLRRAIYDLPTLTHDIDVEHLLNRSMVVYSGIRDTLDDLQIQLRLNSGHAMVQAKSQYTQTLLLLGIIFILIFLIMLYIAYRVSGYVKRSNLQLTSMAMEKSMLLATMSHEIRTPLTSIIGFGETLLETDTTKEERISGINAIVRNGRYLQSVINDVLDYSKLDAGQMELQIESISIAGCLDDLDNMLRGRAQSKGLSFAIIAGDDLPSIIATDSVKLRQILINLLSNAIKFTEHGEVCLQVGFDEASAAMEFSVIDSGVGMAREQLQRLFTPYQQVGRYNRQEGTGLGLYISKQMAELLKGKLSVASEPGKGSTFTFRLPVGDVSGAERVHWSSPGLDTGKVTVNRAVQLSGKVLLAEDRKDNQKLFSIYLGKAGVDLCIVDNGEEAVREALHGDYAVVLMDMQMPVMDGITATEELRLQGYRKPIIALTANTSPEGRQRCQEVGFDDFLNKPISRADFIHVLSRYLVAVDGESEEAGPIFSRLLEQEPDLQPAVDYFIGHLAEIQRQIDEVTARKDWVVLKELIHDLKGTAGGVGYPMLSQLAMEVEFALAKQDEDEVSYLVGMVMNRIQRIQQGYTLQRNDGTPPA